MFIILAVILHCQCSNVVQRKMLDATPFLQQCLWLASLVNRNLNPRCTLVPHPDPPKDESIGMRLGGVWPRD